MCNKAKKLMRDIIFARLNPSLSVCGLTTKEYSVSFFSLVPTCQLKFQSINLFTSDSGVNPIAFVAGDFNGDNRLDLTFLIQLTYSTRYGVQSLIKNRKK
jgi:hypothetical protein